MVKDDGYTMETTDTDDIVITLHGDSSLQWWHNLENLKYRKSDV